MAAGVCNNRRVNNRDRVDVLIVGAGPAGAAAAWHAARAGLTALLVDRASFPRDKTCGDGLTPRAIHQLAAMGLADKITARYRNRGLWLHGFGGCVQAPWPDSVFGRVGSAMPRTELDHLVLQHALTEENVEFVHAAALTPLFHGGQITGVELSTGYVIHPRWVVVADGVRSPFGKLLGREWHQGEVYGIAARSYCVTPRHDDPWIHSHVELRDEAGVVQPGYGWIFPLGNGTANVGCGALSTDARPARINTKKLVHHYAAACGVEWDFGTPQQVASALLPMGGAVSNVAGPNWVLIGDAAACVNPLNGEGIDYALETAQLAVGILQEGKDLTLLWPDMLRQRYGQAFILARTAARMLTYPQFLPLAGPVALRGISGRVIMPAAARLMGNLVTDEDHDVVARAWRASGQLVSRLRSSTPLWASTR